MANDTKKLLDANSNTIAEASFYFEGLFCAVDILDEGIYMEYMNMLGDFCVEEYGGRDAWKKNRDVDRALWVYGHFFTVI